MFSRLFLVCNNFLIRLCRVRVRPENLLLLVPRCLQRDGCPQALGETVSDCRVCGNCNVADLLAIRDEFGIRCSLAAGGREALAFVADKRVRAVVAIACEKELMQGILATFPKPVLGVLNIQSGHPCRNTRMDPASVREAVRSMLRT